GGTLAAGASCTVNVTFAPTVIGRAYGTLSISVDAGVSPQNVPLVGDGVNPPVTVLPTGLTFGLQSVGTSSLAQAVTVKNNQTVGLAIQSVSTSGDFTQSNNCPATLAAGATCTVSVAFAPTVIGTLNGTLTILDGAALSPQQVINLTGTAVPPITAISVTPASVSLGLHGQQQFTAVATFADSSTLDITSSAAWISGDAGVVSVNASGLGTVVATSGSAVPITVSYAGASNAAAPAWVNALASLPRVCTTPTVDLKVLVITNNAANGGVGYADLPAITQVLDYVGTPYTVFDIAANPEGVTDLFLSDGDCHAYYQGVIFAFGSDIYTLPGMSTLASYEQTFGVRQLNWFTYPGTDFGFNAPNDATGVNYSANFTAAAAPVFPQVNTATPLSIANAWIYLATPATPAQGSVTPLLMDNTGNALSLIYNTGGQYPREMLSQTFDSNQYLLHNLRLAYGLLNWVTKGFFLGDYHVYASAQVDDFFINDSEWIPGTPCTNPITHDRTPPDDSSLPTFRLNAADMAALAAWQDAKQADPSGLFSTFTLDLALNAIGTIGDNEWTGLPNPGVDNDDLIVQVQNYQAKFRWLHHTYDHPETLNGMTQAQIHDEISLGNTAATTLGLTNFNPTNIVTPGVTGLNDPNVPGYLVAEGIRYAVTDTSVIGQPNNGPNPSPNVGIPNSFAPELYAVPRYPNNIYFNAANPDDDQAEFQCIYNNPVQPPFNTFTWPDILNFTSDSFVVNMLKGDMNPQMFHQPNLHDYDGLGHSLISDTYDQTFSKYKALYTLPVLNLSLDQLGESMKARDRYNKSGVTGSWTGGAAPSVTLSMPAAAEVPSATIPVTGLNSVGAEVYGGAYISHINMNAGDTVTLPAQ
ncbi:MAG TPA: choice-of-anchor D domain-containing protein, partial [Terriglobales bacterium]